MTEKKPRKSKNQNDSEKKPEKIHLSIEGNVNTANIIIGDNNQASINAAKPASDYPLPAYNSTDVLPPPADLPLGSYLPFGRNPLFTGREADLKSLAESLLNQHTAGTVIHQAIAGMGGLGKTQLAVEFAYRYGKFFRGVHWLNLANPELLNGEIAASGAQLGLPNFPEDQPSQVTLMLNTWKAQGPRLLILDNFEAVAQVNTVMKNFNHSNLRVLITSRRSDFPITSGLGMLALEVFSETESLAFLKSSTPKRKDTEDEFKTLSVKLGHLPLGLELASRYLNAHPRLRISDYLEQAKEALAHPSMKNFRADLPAPTGHDLDLQNTFALSWLALCEDGGRVVSSDSEKRIETTTDEGLDTSEKNTRSTRPSNTEVAQKIFQAAGYLAPNTPIPLEIFEKTFELTNETCDEALTLLYGLGLLRESDSLPAIHPLLAEYARGSVDEDTEILEAVAETLGTLSKEALDTGLPALFISIKPHMPALAQYAEAGKIQSAGTLWNNYGSHLNMVADYSGARNAYEHALIVEPDNATLVNNLGMVMQDLGDLRGARAACERALKIDEAAFGPDHPKVAIRVNNLGGVMQDLGDLGGARVAYERALKINEAAFGPDHPNVAIDVNSLGSVMQDLGDLEGARTAFERALKIWEANLGPDDPQVATGINNLGSVMKDLGDLEGARAAYERAIKIFEANLGENHPQVATGINNLGSVMKDLGDFEGARAAYERALKIDEAAFGPDHPKVAQRLWWLGVISRDEGNKEIAKEYFEHALKIYKKFLPHEHSTIKSVQGFLDSLK